MNRSNVKTYRYRVGKKHYIVIKIKQRAVGETDSGNVIASNAVNIQIDKKKKKKR